MVFAWLAVLLSSACFSSLIFSVFAVRSLVCASNFVESSAIWWTGCVVIGSAWLCYDSPYISLTNATRRSIHFVTPAFISDLKFMESLRCFLALSEYAFASDSLFKYMVVCLGLRLVLFWVSGRRRPLAVDPETFCGF